MNGRRPIATNTMSASNTSAPPPLAASTETLTPFADVSVPTTFVPSLNLKPCFFSIRVKFFTTSASMPGKILSKNSTTVTSAPKRLHTEPSSRPITPPPTTMSFFGTSLSSRPPVEETILSSSMSTPGNGITSEPVAMTMFLVLISVTAPSSAVTDTLPAARILPVPWKTVILFFLNRKSMPAVLPSMTFCLCAIILARFSLGVPTSMPRVAKLCSASSNISEACNKAFEGMQPTLRQVPP